MTAFTKPDLGDRTAAANHRQWLVTGTWLALVVAAMIAMFWEASIGAFRVWRGSETFNHCFLIVPIVAYLLWDRRDVFSTTAPRPSPWLLAVLPLPVLVWLVGDIAAVLELQQFAAMATLQVAIAAIIGVAAYRALMFPCLYLFLLVPTGEWLTPPLQDLTTWFVVNGLELLSIPVYADGVFIDIPNGRFEVAEACAGLRFLIASVAFGLLFANLIYRSSGRRVVFVVLSLVVPVIANGFRALGIVLLAHWSDNQIAVGVDHIVYGWGFFTAILLALIWMGLRYREDTQAHAALRPTVASGTGLRRPSQPRIAAVALLALGIAALGPGYATRLHAAPAGGLVIALPDTAAPWARVPWNSSWRPVYYGATASVAQAYSNSSHTVELFIALYTDQDHDRKLIGFMNRLEDGEIWRRIGDSTTSLTIDGVRQNAVLRRLDGRGISRFVWRLYWIDGHWTASELQARIWYVLDKLLRGRSAAATLVVASAAPTEAAAAQAAQGLLQAMPDLSGLLRVSSERAWR